MAITSCGPDVAKAREPELQEIYSGAFDRVICLPMGASKREVLAEVSPAFYVEDCAEHADDAVDLSIKTFIIDASYNQQCTATRVYNWKEIRDLVLQGE